MENLPKNQEYLNELIKQVAHHKLKVEDLPPEWQNFLAQSEIMRDLQKQFRNKVLAERVDWIRERENFINSQKSEKTKKLYASCIRRFEDWLGFKNLSWVDVGPGEADQYINELADGRVDTDSIRVWIAGASSFYTFLTRRYSELQNPFRGTKVRPRSTWKTATIPTEEETKIIVSEAMPILRAALILIIETGLRVGALPSLTIRMVQGEPRFQAQTKGKTYIAPDPMPASALEAVRGAGLSGSKPFAPENFDPPFLSEKVTVDWFSNALARLMDHLKKQGHIADKYSFTDFRHLFAQRNLSKGLYWLKERLGHSSVSITERYLKNTFGSNFDHG